MRRVNTAKLRILGSIWGVVGIIFILSAAIFRLLPHALEIFTVNLSLAQWSILFMWSVFMLYSEGYDGFYKRLAPRIIARAQVIARKGDLLAIVFAPAYCFGYFRAPRRQVIVSYIVLTLIVMAIIVVHHLPQPGRGIIDCGVILGLFYGLSCVAWKGFQVIAPRLRK